MPRLTSITGQSLTGIGKSQQFFYPLSNSATDPTDSGAAIRDTPGYTFVANEGIYTTAPITDLSSAFVFTSFNDPDINLWDVSTVTSLANTFAFNSTFNQPLDNWDVSNVTSMNQMFYTASGFDQDLSGWDTSSCTDMRRALETGSVYSYDLSGWNVDLITTYPNPQFADSGNFPIDRQPRFEPLVWSLQQTLDNPNAFGTSQTDFFARTVGVSGNFVIAGAENEAESEAVTFAGKTYIFNATTGAVAHTIDNPNDFNTSVGDTFGRAVAISGDRAIASATNEDDANGTNGGTAYILNVTTGAVVHTLNNPNASGTSSQDQFGYSLDIDGNYAIVGASFEDDLGNNSGVAYIFDVTTGGLVHTLSNPNFYDTPDGDTFGWSVAISGERAIVGANAEDEVGVFTTGVAYIFNATTGALVHTLENPNAVGGTDGDRFGGSVAIHGNRAIVGSTDENETATNSGKAYIFDVTTGALVYELDNPNAFDTAQGDSFGTAVGLTDKYAFVSAMNEDDAGGTGSGKVYVFDLASGDLVQTIDNPNAYDTSQDDQFGRSLSVEGTTLVVGTMNEDDVNGIFSGKAYIYTLGLA